MKKKTDKVPEAAKKASVTIQELPLKKFFAHPKNPRKHPAKGSPEYNALKESLEYDYFDPVVWNKRNSMLVSGHLRVKVLADMGFTHADAVVVDYDEATHIARMIAANKLQGENEVDVLSELLKASEDAGNLFLTGHTKEELSAMLGEVPPPITQDSPPSPSKVLLKKWKCKRGDLWQIGKHRLLCGDSTNPDDVKRLMNKEKAILFATDPPYLVNYTGANRPGKGSKSGGKDWSDSYGKAWSGDELQKNLELYNMFVEVAVKEALCENAAWYCWYANSLRHLIEKAWNKQGAFFHQQIIWLKSKIVISRLEYFSKHEPCCFGWVKGKRPPRARKTQDSDVWAIDSVNQAEKPDHPTVKPLEVFAIPMRQHTKENELCYEPFAGSGTQIVAAEQLNRRCYAMEISPEYCAVILERLTNIGLDPKPA